MKDFTKKVELSNVVIVLVTYAADVELSYGPLGQNRLWQHLDDQVSVVQRILIKWPIVITLYLEQSRNNRPTPEHVKNR